MVIDLIRRRLLLTALAAGLVRTLPAIADMPTVHPSLLGAWRNAGRDYVGIWDPHAGARGVELPFRAHQVLRRPSSAPSAVAVAIARRPGEFLARVDLGSLRLDHLSAIDPEFVTSGHALFTTDGSTLLVAESDALTGEGFIAHYDAQSFKCFARHSTYGIGPHAFLREASGSLLIANGGVLTLSQSGRTKLNAGSIESSLARVSNDGQLLGLWTLEDRDLSIRHVAQSRDGTVGIALQAEHESEADRVSAPVFAVFDGRSLVCADRPASPLGGYAGDIACIETVAGPLFAVGCARGGVVTVWDADRRMRMLGRLPKACAVVADGSSFVAPSETGVLGLLAPATQAITLHRGTPIWDNHAQVWQRYR
jgi:uncharacterized protein